MIAWVRGRSPSMGEVSEAMRVRHYSIRIDRAYLDWIRRFILFHDKRHPREMGERKAKVVLKVLPL